MFLQTRQATGFTVITAPVFLGRSLAPSNKCSLFSNLRRLNITRRRCHHTLHTTASASLNDLQTVSESLGLTSAQISKLHRLTDLVITANQSMNLTAIKTTDEITAKHIFDAFTLLPTLDELKPRRVIDVGTGAGFPGFVLAIVRPDIHYTLLDSVRKKTTFLDQVISDLSLNNVDSVWARAEEAGQNMHRERYCLAVARSVAPMNVLSELVLPLVRVGGTFVAQKMVDTEHSEIKSAKTAITQLGGRLQSVTPTSPHTFGKSDSFTDREGNVRQKALVIVDKVKASPRRYPRQPGTPKKTPIR